MEKKSLLEQAIEICKESGLSDSEINEAITDAEKGIAYMIVLNLDGTTRIKKVYTKQKDN